MSWKRLSLAISYVTCLPVAAAADLADENLLAGLSKHLPGVGLILGGLFSSFAFALSWQHVNPLLAAALVTSAWLWLTGALHMDGLMDTADGVFSHRSRERMLEIMQDSRVGNFAVLTAISVLSLKLFSLATLSSVNLKGLLIALILIPAWARFCEVYAIGKFDYARQFGKGKIWHDTTIFPHDLLLAVTPVLLATAALAYFDVRMALIASLATIACGVLTAHWLDSKIGGHTGDTYGAVVEAAETLGMLIAALSF